MRLRLLCSVLVAGLSVGVATSALAASVFQTSVDDPRAVTVTGAHADSLGDDTAALQQAVDKAAGTGAEGLVFVPAGRYRLTHTLYIWPGVRLFGFGKVRPVFVLGDNTPGFQQGVADMVLFTGARRSPDVHVPVPPQGTVPADPTIADANSATFYSAMSNIDFLIGAGNPAAIAVRFHVAQHAFLSHMDFHVGSGLAALTQVGNEAEDLHIYGGRYGILTEKTSPAWQFTLIDSTFEGQRESAIREHEAGLTLIHDTFRNVPAGIDIDPQYYDQLWVKDCRFENIAGPVVTISSEQSPLNEIGFQNVTLLHAPTFALLRESGRKIAGKGELYRVADFTYGLIVPAEGTMGSIGMHYDAMPLTTAPALLPPAIPALPPTAEWINVKSLGVKGDGTTDDTAALQRAIASHRVLYLPSGHYVVTDTLTLRPDSVLIGLHPTLTQLDLPDNTPAFRDVGAPKPIVLAPSGATNVLSGIGVMTGGVNPRAVGTLWMAGEHSLIDDVRFLGGHGSGTNPYNNNHTADPDLRKRWDGQYPSLWITQGGGGTFADIWTPDTFAQAGFYVTDTATPGHVYELSNEHHVRNEIKLDHVENWDFNAPQTEEEAGESPESLSLEIDNSRNITIANYHAYRVTRSRAPYPTAVRLFHAQDIHFRNVHVNAESGFSTCDAEGCGTFLRVSKYPYENAITDMTHHLEVREREFAALDIPAAPAPAAVPEGSAVLTTPKVEKLEDGFFSIAGAAVDASGKLYFVDRHEQRIYSWSRTEGLGVERDQPLDPVNLAFDKSGNLLVLSSSGSAGTVYTFHPGAPANQIAVLQPERLNHIVGAIAILPVNYWNNGEFRDQLHPDTMTFTTLAEMFQTDVSTAKAQQYASADGSVFLPAGHVYQQGPATDTSGWRFSDNLDTYGFINAAPGSEVYVSSESEDITYRARANSDGTLTNLQPFAQRGGESVAVDTNGNVYVANGQIFVYNPQGKQIAEIDVPERPLDLVFGGDERKTLFILAHHALFAAHVR